MRRVDPELTEVNTPESSTSQDNLPSPPRRRFFFAGRCVAQVGDPSAGRDVTDLRLVDPSELCSIAIQHVPHRGPCEPHHAGDGKHASTHRRAQSRKTTGSESRGPRTGPKCRRQWPGALIFPEPGRDHAIVDRIKRAFQMRPPPDEAQQAHKASSDPATGSPATTGPGCSHRDSAGARDRPAIEGMSSAT